MNCSYCNKDIPRGQKFKGTEKYKSKSFCSKECYDNYCKEKETKKETYPGWRNLTDYIKLIYEDASLNWSTIAQQIKNLLTNYDLTCDEIYDIIKYAVELEGHIVKQDVLLGQFIPKYIDRYQRFLEQLKLNEQQSNNYQMITKIIKPKKLNSIRHRRK